MIRFIVVILVFTLLGSGDPNIPPDDSPINTSKNTGVEASAKSKSTGISKKTKPIDYGEMTDATHQKNISSALKDIGIAINEIKEIKKIKNWASGPRYTMSYDGRNLVAYFWGNGALNSINVDSGVGTHLWQEGLEPKKIKDYSIDIGTASALVELAKEAVSPALKYPDEADFPFIFGWSVGREGDLYQVSSTVKASNALGVKSEIPFNVQFKKSGSSFSTTYIWVDGETIYGVPAKTLESKEIAPAEQSSNKITLTDGIKGKYGKVKIVGGGEYIYFYVPAGEYSVESRGSNGKLFLDKNKTKKVNGFDECIEITTLSFSKAGDKKTLNVPKNTHIELMVGTSVVLSK